MKDDKRTTADDWFFQARPWGWMIKLIHTRTLWVKVIRMKRRNSLQTHDHRKEIHLSFWKMKRIAVNEKHRMEPGLYLEIAYGLPAEDDIKRYEDDFGRADK